MSLQRRTTLTKFLIEQLKYFNPFKPANLSLPLTHLLRKAARIGSRVLQVVLRISILIDANGNDVSSAFAFERVGAGEHERGIFTLNVVAIESVRHQTIWTSSHRDLFLERDGCLTF